MDKGFFLYVYHFLEVVGEGVRQRSNGRFGGFQMGR